MAYVKGICASNKKQMQSVKSLPLTNGLIGFLKREKSNNLDDPDGFQYHWQHFCQEQQYSSYYWYKDVTGSTVMVRLKLPCQQIIIGKKILF